MKPTEIEPGELIELSIIAPSHNEKENLPELIRDICNAPGLSNVGFEIIVVDDGSTDGSADVLRQLASKYPAMRSYRMLETPRDSGNGQSAAFFAGLRRSRGRLVALMDADLQNDPADLYSMLEHFEDDDVDMVQGDRSAGRRDSAIRKISSWVGRSFRRMVLGDTIKDTGCSLRVFRRELGLELPLQYAGMHRFIPAYARLLGYRVIEVPVNHRARNAGQSKYGIWNRALPGLRDLFAVRWMRARLRPTRCEPITPQDPGGQ